MQLPGKNVSIALIRDWVNARIHGSEIKLKDGALVCPFPGCSDGRGGRSVVLQGSKLGELRAHVNSHLAEQKFDISNNWFTTSNSRWCPCGQWVTSLSLSCSTCRGSHSEIVHRTPIADGLPPPPGMKPDISVRLRGPDIQSIPRDGKEFKAFGEGQEGKGQ